MLVYSLIIKISIDNYPYPIFRVSFKTPRRELSIHDVWQFLFIPICQILLSSLYS